MSRHEIAGHNESHEVSVGWDNPLMTFFAIVIDSNTEEEDVLVWLGTEPSSYQDIEDLADDLAPYADIPDAIRDELIADRADALAEDPTPSQRQGWTIGGG